MNSIHGTEVKDIITKFFYRSNHLCFQILIRIENGEMVPYREFTDFSEYKKNFSELQQAKAKGTVVKVLEKTFAPGFAVPKVA